MNFRFCEATKQGEAKRYEYDVKANGGYENIKFYMRIRTMMAKHSSGNTRTSGFCAFRKMGWLVLEAATSCEAFLRLILWSTKALRHGMTQKKKNHNQSNSFTHKQSHTVGLGMAATNTAENEIRTETIKHDAQRLEKLRTAFIIFCLFCGGNGAMMYKTVLYEPDLLAVYSIWMGKL